MSGWVLKCHYKYLKRKRENREKKEMWIKRYQLECCSHKPRMASSHRNSKRQATDSSQELTEEMKPCQHLVFRLLASRTEYISCCCFKFVAICYNSHRKLIEKVRSKTGCAYKWNHFTCKNCLNLQKHFLESVSELSKVAGWKYIEIIWIFIYFIYYQKLSENWILK